MLCINSRGFCSETVTQERVLWLLAAWVRSRHSFGNDLREWDTRGCLTYRSPVRTDKPPALNMNESS